MTRAVSADRCCRGNGWRAQPGRRGQAGASDGGPVSRCVGQRPKLGCCCCRARRAGTMARITPTLLTSSSEHSVAAAAAKIIPSPRRRRPSAAVSERTRLPPSAAASASARGGRACRVARPCVGRGQPEMLAALALNVSLSRPTCWRRWL